MTRELLLEIQRKALRWIFAIALTASTFAAPKVDFAKAKQHWAFQPVQDPPLPAVHNSDWPRNSIDYFILSKLEESGLAPIRPADKRTLIRRVTFDLTGLPPTFEETQAFVADDSPGAYEALVKRLLASPAYGEHWGRRWLDVVRYADTAGETADYPVPVAWRYRNYVINAFNNDKPYNEFIREQVAGDILAREGDRAHYAERVTATGFIALSRRFGFDSENYHHLTIQDTLDTLGQSVLGLSLGCARCHDHKYDPVPAKDYYALYGIFQSTRYAFPGSEQKQKLRALVPLIPPDESEPKWQEYTARVALLKSRLERQKQGVPSALLRSLDDIDGDFEIQAPASGGSRGVLVPPWQFAGDVFASGEAQSPYQNVYSSGRVGVVFGVASNNMATIYQAIHPRRSRAEGKPVYLNFDFKLDPSGGGSGERRLWAGHRPSHGERSPAFEISISASGLAWRLGSEWRRVQSPGSGPGAEWQSVQLSVDLQAGMAIGTIARKGEVTTFKEPLLSDWNGTLDWLAIETVVSPGDSVPKLCLDNLAIRGNPIPATNVAPSEQDRDTGYERFTRLVGNDGDFEFQTSGKQPAEPWYPGPNSKVTLSPDAQSPFQNLYPRGALGLRMERGTAYDGFVQKFSRTWKAGDTNALNVSFDFQTGAKDSGNSGSWRFYLGHGAGSSAALELYITGNALFAKSGMAISQASGISPGEWQQLSLVLNLAEKSYSGTLSSTSAEKSFSGKFADGWDGVLDHVFIDSYGHSGGARPELSADNFAFSDRRLPPINAKAVEVTSEAETARRKEREELREILAAARLQTDKDRKELEGLLSSGPFDFAYGVVDGTPEDAPVQLRGEPDKPGPVVPRGFLTALDARSLPENAKGSGRLELADWLIADENPLTRRVIVNRIWKYHFGRGLVETPNDFGLRGQVPSHPELLDHLAVEFMKRGWSMKQLHRLILLSGTYQQATSDGADASARSLYAGVERRRLMAEELRDSILLVTGELDLSPGSTHAFPAPFTWGYTQHSPFNAVYDHHRRSVYLMQQRIKRHPYLALFDGADPNASVSERRVTTVPTQSLFFLNDPQVHGNSERLASHLLEQGKSNEVVAQLAWQNILGRVPTEQERDEALDFLRDYEAELKRANAAGVPIKAVAALTRTLMGSNEFLHID